MRGRLKRGGRARKRAVEGGRAKTVICACWCRLEVTRAFRERREGRGDR